MTQAAFQATYSDWRLIKGRKVVQVVFEVPLEGAGQAYDALGGMPDPSKEVWCAVARLNANRKEGLDTPVAPAKAPASEADNASPVRVPRKWEDVPATTQACIRCNEVPFVKFLNVEFDANITTTAGAEQFVRDYCGVESRRDIRGGEPLRLWQELDGLFGAWNLAPQVGAV